VAGYRECSIQRRYQKIIEETPSMAVDGAMRERMGKTACDLALKAGYANAGTVEFILDQEGNFYFIEMNTRLQVEHPVTEMVTGLDLVELQLRIAEGEALAFGQRDITFRGWSIEARICAEDPRRDFYPSTGIITRYTSPRGRNIRIDTGIEAGSVVSIYYDSLLAKVAAWGETREDARKALVYGLNGYHIEGLATNADFVNAILNHPAFVNGELSTDFIEAHFENGRVKLEPPPERIHLMSIAATLVYHNRQNQIRESLRPMAAHVGGVFAPKEYTPYVVKGENDILELRLQGDHDANVWTVWVNDTAYNVVTPDFEFYRRRLKLRINGEPHMFRLQYHGNFISAAFCGTARIFEIYSPREWALARYMPTLEKPLRANLLECPMPGLIVDIRVQKGDRVYKGQELVIIEAMKMESAVASPRDGEIEDVMVKNGQAVEIGNLLVVFKV
jgi:propionyl-CoA carboxylase alpha chain